MTSPHHAATKAAMKAAGCHVEEYGTDADPVWECRYHLRESRSPGLCGEIDQAVAIGYEAGRRDALEEAAGLLDKVSSDSSYKDPYEVTEVYIYAAGIVRSLLSDNEETKP